MPLLVDSGRTPIRWAGDKYPRAAEAFPEVAGSSSLLRIALVNNMPDAAVEDTESQFFALLDAAAGENPVQVQLFSLPKISRGERAQQHLDNFYSSTTALLDQSFDGVIITGTEPRQPDLRNEPYWQPLVEVFDWAAENTLSAVLSCLAAHASVLRSDGIRRTPLGEKRFGVFEHTKIDHPMTRGLAETIRVPHSRWNGVSEEDLTSAGYSVVTKSPHAGVDLFAKEQKNSLFIHFQGHPEYVAETLYKEYRRDVKRYLRKERETYPLMPEGYFQTTTAELLDGFRLKAQAERSDATMKDFPEGNVVASLQHFWLASSRQIYKNWLGCIASRKQAAAGVTKMLQVNVSKTLTYEAGA